MMLYMYMQHVRLSVIGTSHRAWRRLKRSLNESGGAVHLQTEVSFLAMMFQYKFWWEGSIVQRKILKLCWIIYSA